MAVRFVLGRAGSGKTRHCVGLVVEMCRADPLGPPIFFIVPKQATFQAQRRFVALLGGFSRIRVLSFDQLGSEILAACGDVGIPEVTPVGRLLVIGHVLRRHRGELCFYNRSATQPGLAAELDETFGEFDRAGVDGQRLDELIDTIPADSDPALVDKLHDVRKLFAAYQDFIGQDRLDPHKRLRLVLEKVEKCTLFENAAVFVDDFYDFTAYERDLLVGVAGKADTTEIALQLDPDLLGSTDELSTFHRTARTYELLGKASEGVPQLRPVLCHKPERFESAVLSSIESVFAGKLVDDRSGVVTMIEAADVRAEVDAVARRIRDAVIDGHRYRDLCVLVRDLSAYHDVVRTVFGEYGIPFFADVRRSATHHPVVQLIRSSMLIVARQWPTDAVITLVKSGLAGLSDDEADELENAAIDLNIRGGEWASDHPWQSTDNETVADRPDDGLSTEISVDHLRRRLKASLAPLLEAGRAGRPVKDWVERISRVLDQFGVRATLIGWIKEAEEAKDFEQRAEHEQVWTEAVALMDQLVKLLGDVELSASDFLAVLDSALARFELAITPPTIDQVLVGQVDRTRTPEVKVAFVMGLNEGEFPKTHGEQAVLSDAERRTLRRRNVELDQDTERLLLDEKFLGYLAVTRASQSLVVSRPLADSAGRARTPSRYWRLIAAVAGGSRTTTVDRRGKAGPESIGTARQAVAGVMKWVRDGAKESTWAGVYQRLSTELGVGSCELGVADGASPDSRLSTPGSQLKRRTGDRSTTADSFHAAIADGWQALSYFNDAELTESSATGLFPAPLSATARQLETFAECPFRHFVRHGLGLRDRLDGDGIRRDENALFRSVLDRAVRPHSPFDPADGGDALDEAMEQIGLWVEAACHGSLQDDTGRNQYLLNRITRTLRQVIMSAVLTNRLGNLRWARTDVRFGPAGELPSLSIDTPRRLGVELHGRIERLDVGPGGEAIVTDYRLTAAKTALDRVVHGLSLQMLSQLLVLRQHGDRLLGRPLAVAGALTAPLRRPIDSVKDPAKSADPSEEAFHLRRQPSGLFTESAIGLLHKESFTGHSPAFNVYRKSDGTLGFIERSDAVSAEQFEAILQLVEQKIGELADGVMGGDVSVRPAEMGSYRACSYCDYRSVCRFDPVMDRYRELKPKPRAEVFAELSVGGEVLGAAGASRSVDRRDSTDGLAPAAPMSGGDR